MRGADGGRRSSISGRLDGAHGARFQHKASKAAGSGGEETFFFYMFQYNLSLGSNMT